MKSAVAQDETLDVPVAEAAAETADETAEEIADILTIAFALWRREEDKA